MKRLSLTSFEWHTLGVFRLLLALLIAVALAGEFLLDFNGTLASVIHYFSYFTVLSNFFALIVFTSGGLDLVQGKTGSLSGVIRATALLYLLTTGIIYTLLLSTGAVDNAPWINMTLHYIAPTLILFDWFIALPREQFRHRTILYWLVFPLCYLGYILLYGFDSQWYPYPFLTPTMGYANVLISTLFIGVIIAVLGALIVQSTKWRIRQAN